MPDTHLFGAVNTVATKVEICEPWTFVPNIPPGVLNDEKGNYTQWRSQPETEHLVFTASEGINDGLRVNKHNPLRALHGLIADFDSKVNDTTFDEAIERVPADLRPAWISRTMHSGGVRLVWLFEEPLPLEVGPFAKEFLRIASVELRLRKSFGGFDEPAFFDLTKLYDVGRDWRKLSDDRLSANVLNYWLTKAAAKTRWDDLGEMHIPLSEVAAEAERRYPGRWEGDFEVGKRGVVFFNPESKNPTAAIVTEAGMICFGEEQIFYPWTHSRVFGMAWGQKFQADKIGAAVAHVWYDGKSYFSKSEYGVWEPHAKEDFVALLKVDHAIDQAKDRGDTASEMDKTLVYVQKHRRVTGVVPKVYDPQELLYFNGKRFLNCAAVVPMIPADTKQEWGENFPWLAEFLTTCWDKTDVPCVTPGLPAVPAKTIFFAWLKRFYCSALAGELRKGQALFLAGGVGLGKTLLGTQIVARLMGGASDASHFLNSDTNFNKELLETALWSVDDAVAANDPQAHQKFSEMVKRAVANPFFNYRAMYRDAQRVEWHGRVIVTLNDDASSIRIIPNLDASIEDKVVVLLFDTALRVFPDWHELDDIFTTELPFLARWLVDWEVPAEVCGNKRFGIHSYIDESLRVKSLHAGGVSDLLELISLWIKRRRPQDHEGKLRTHWQGTATEWMAEINSDDALRPMASKFTVRSLGRKFVEASRVQGSGVEIAGESGHGNTYKILLPTS